MRILHVITRLILGGAQQNTVLCCAAQAEAGHEVHLAYGPIRGPEGTLLPLARQSGAVLHEVPTLEREIRPLADQAARRALVRLIRSGGRLKTTAGAPAEPFDVVHTHSSKAGILGRSAAWSCRSSTQGRTHRLPVVVHTVHGLPFHDRMPRWKKRLLVGSERWAARRCDALIAITPAMAEAFAAEGIAPVDRFVVIPSGVSLETFAAAAARADRVAMLRERLGLPQDDLLVGLVARLDPLKGHRDLLAAWPGVRARLDAHPATAGRRTRLVFVGDGFDAAGIHTAVDAAGLGDQVTFTGLMSLGDMPLVYRMLDLVVLPSHQEGQSRVLVEALACGTPVVAYDVGGMPSIVVDGRTGRLVQPGRTDALAGVVAWMLEHPEQAAALAENGRRHVHQRFSARTMCDQLEQLYERLTARGAEPATSVDAPTLNAHGQPHRRPDRSA